MTGRPLRHRVHSGVPTLRSPVLAAAGLAAALSGTAPAASQTPHDDVASGPRALLRVQAGALNADRLFDATLSIGGSLGFEWNDRRALLLSYVRQSGNGNEAEDLREDGRGFLTAGFEWGFTFEEIRRQQYRLRVGAGAVFRSYGLATAPVIEAGLAIRYLLWPRLAAVGLLEDKIAFLPPEEFVACEPTCLTYTVEQRQQHNVGLLVGVEWRP